jgi:uncharacterized FAD-dependent dehydrogenase
LADVLIIGAGPAGLFAAHELSKKSDLSVQIIDKGKDIDKRACPVIRTGECARCKPCDVMCGVGGAGGMSDGTLNLRHDIGGDLTEFTGKVSDAKRLVEEVDSIFQEHGAPKETYGRDSEATEKLTRRAAAAGVKFIPIPQRHIGSEYLPDLIGSLKRKLEKQGVKFKLNSEVERIEKNKVVVKGKRVKAKYILAAPGRAGAPWFARQAGELGIKLTHGAIDVGVRVEVPAVVMEPITKISRDPKFHVITKTFDDFVRTFCTNHQGFVVEELYDDFYGVNGHAMRMKKSENTNFAFLSHVELTQPVTDTASYGRSIAYLATTIGGGRPLLQRLGDLRHGQRSTWDRIERGHVKPTLRSVTPGDISMALPGRIVTNIKEGLEQLDQLIPGVASDATLLYAPEVKLYATRISVNKNMETNVPNLFVAGDGAGLSRDIINASATGILAARGIMKKAGIKY